MAKVTIRRFSFSDQAEEKFWTHGLTRRQGEEVLLNRFVVTINRKDRAAGHLAIGRDNNGRCLTIPVMPTDDPVVWRPLTGARQRFAIGDLMRDSRVAPASAARGGRHQAAETPRRGDGCRAAARGAATSAAKL